MNAIKPLESPWSQETQDIFNSLKTSHNGLSEEEAVKRLEDFGKNTFQRREKKSMFELFIKQLASPLIFILIGAAIITAVLHEWVEVVVIVFAILINTGLGFYREYHAENTLEKLSSFIKDRTRVIRAGREEEIDAEEIVVGDILKLTYGSRVPADARIIDFTNLSVDEAILTGESVPIHKSIEVKSASIDIGERTNMVFAGTLIVEGFATAIVTSIGNNTEIGKIAGLVSDTHRAKTPIQKGLSNLAWIIFVVLMCLVAGIFFIGISRGESVLEMLILSAAISVGAVPEALPIALTVILSIGAERIAKKRGITRTLVASETLGSTSLIMTDKTGTLTEANMRLVEIYTHEKKVSENDILEYAIDSVDVLVENAHEKESEWNFKGKPFEVNIVKTAREHGLDISRFGTGGKSKIVIPFNSAHKFSVAQKEKFQVVMGAPDILLNLSKIEKDEFVQIEKWIADASVAGKRLIAVATMEKNAKKIDEVKDLKFIGILAFFDPVRKEVPETIKKIESLGVKIVMVTGDLVGTALSVARELGWNVQENQVLTGSGLRKMSDNELLQVLPNMKIFARVTPEDKLRIGLLYKSLGEIVAMTGDGVNDAPALKAMDIGVALGSGSDVAKSAADLVLLDDNFHTISLSIQEGRRILKNIQKTFVYLMSNSLDAVVVVGGSLLAGIALPVTALQIIWVNLFTGSLPAIAFAYDEDFDHDSVKKHSMKSIFTREVNIMTFGIGTVSSFLLFFMYRTLLSFDIDVAVVRSIFFVCFASYVLAIAFSFRSIHKPLFSYPIFSNKKLNQSILIAIVIIVATMTIPAIRNLFDLAPMPLIWIWFVFGWLVLNVCLVELAKYIFRKTR